SLWQLWIQLQRAVQMLQTLVEILRALIRALAFVGYRHLQQRRTLVAMQPGILRQTLESPVELDDCLAGVSLRQIVLAQRIVSVRAGILACRVPKVGERSLQGGIVPGLCRATQRHGSRAPTKPRHAPFGRRLA